MIGAMAFTGIRPVLAGHLLQDNEAQIADNCGLDSGDIRQIQRPLVVASFSVSNVDTFMLYDTAGVQRWLTWSDKGTSVVPGPIHGDEKGRHYLTDSDGAKIFTVDEVEAAIFASKKLGVPAPIATPSTSVTGAGSGDSYTTAYVFTLVSSLGEEGAPSPASGLVTVTPGQTIELTGLNTPVVTGYNTMTNKRIYRANTGTSGSTEYQFVAEIAVDNTTYSDTVANADLGEVLPSEEWILPPDGLQGMIANKGLYAGFKGRDLWYCDPYYPHAWPLKYNQTVESDVVGHCFSGDFQVILTKGKAYVSDCSDISYAVPRGLQGSSPCMSSKGIVSTEYGVLFPGQDGLYLVHPSSNAAQNITKGIIWSETDWRSMRPESMVAAWHLQKYYCFYEDMNGVRRGFVLDVSGEGVKPARGLGFHASATFIDSDGNKLYLACESAGKTDIAKWEGSILSYRAEWKSKKFKTASPVNMAAALVSAEYREGLSEEVFELRRQELLEAYADFIEAGDFYGEISAAGPGEYTFGGDALDSIYINYVETPQIILSVYGNGKLRHTQEVNLDEPFTLPSGYTAKEWEFSISADVPVSSVKIATSMLELLSS